MIVAWKGGRGRGKTSDQMRKISLQPHQVCLFSLPLTKKSPQDVKCKSFKTRGKNKILKPNGSKIERNTVFIRLTALGAY